MNKTEILPDLFLEGDSKNFRNWQSEYTQIKTCADCRNNHGKIYDFDVERYLPNHPYCRCYIIPMRTRQVGTVTNKGFDGADAWLMYRGRLPDYYVTKEEAALAGWIPNKHNLQVLPGKMIGGDVYKNRCGLLPEKITEFGLRLILTLKEVTETEEEFCIQMTD